MSKLAHSNEASMSLIGVRRAIEDGNEDMVGLIRITVHRCELQGCGRDAEFLFDAVEERRRTGVLDSEGRYLCRKHAEQWAAKEGGE